MTFDDAKRHVLDAARARSLDAEVLGSETRELTLESFEGALSELKHARRGGIGVRVVVDGATGYAYSEELTPSALDWALDEAAENARLQEADDGFLPDGELRPRSDLIGEGLSASLDEKAAAVHQLEDTLRADPATDQIMVARYSERESHDVLGSTRGADGGYRNGYALLAASFVAKRGDSLKQGGDVALAKEFHALDPATTAETMLASTTRLLGAEPLATGRYRAWFEPTVVASLLGLVLYALSGKRLVEGTSRFAGRLGERVASSLVTLVDDPTLDGGLATRPFDSEGTPAQRTPLIDGGVLRSFLHNSATARKAGHANTGHAARSYKSALDVGCSNLVLAPGAGIEPVDGVIVTDVMGLHAGANPVTGDVSLQGLGLRVEDGRRRPVENFVFAGNLFAMLEAVSAIGDDPTWRPLAGGAALVPSLEIDELRFAGS